MEEQGTTDGVRSVVDRAVAAVALVVTAPLWPVAAAVVLATLGRPVLFRQQRGGLGMRSFDICKFRTMADAAGPDGAPLADAEREVPLTRAMRRLRVDELPQLLAIIRGDMALIGPRPLLPSTLRAFGSTGRLRSSVRPGLTGWAQVNGNTRLDDRQKLALDLWYIRHRSLALDLRILGATVLTLLFGERVNPANLSAAEAELDGLSAETHSPRLWLAASGDSH